MIFEFFDQKYIEKVYLKLNLAHFTKQERFNLFIVTHCHCLAVFVIYMNVLSNNCSNAVLFLLGVNKAVFPFPMVL